ncbi:hydrogenase 2 protein HybA, partial [Yersinia enterocolitica]|nr:hydrogenase 2 protein HybA [Yersinia enterocolitica]
TLKPGENYRFPRQTLSANDTYEHPVAHYDPHVYGEKEGGGTQVLVLAGIPTEKLDLPPLAELATGARSEHVQHTLYKGMILPLAVLAGVTALVHRNTRDERKDSDSDKHDKKDGHDDDA